MGRFELLAAHQEHCRQHGRQRSAGSVFRADLRVGLDRVRSHCHFHAPLPWTILATAGPTVAAIVAHRFAEGNTQAFRIGSTWVRTLGATAVGVALMVLAYVVLPAVTTADPRKLHWSALTSVSVYNYSTLLGGPLFEEPGWRGFALPRLEARWGPVGGSAVLSLLWAGWHLPLARRCEGTASRGCSERSAVDVIGSGPPASHRQPFRSTLSLAFAAATVCHCMLPELSAPPHASATM